MKRAVAQAQARYVAQRVGLAGWLGVAALVSAVVLAGMRPFALAPANDELAGELSQLTAELARAQSPAPTLSAAADPVASIVAQLPTAEQVPQFLQQVQAQAALRGLQIDRTEYRVQKALGGRALRYQLTMPAHGTYPALRGWLETLLHEHPSAALDDFSVRRESDGGAQLEARVGLSLYSQDAR